MNKKSISDLDNLEAALRLHEERSFGGRLQRLRFLLALWEGGGNFLTSLPALEFFEGARLCFLSGAFVATIVMAQMCAAELLRSLFRWKGTDSLPTEDAETVRTHKAGFKQLIWADREYGYISERQATDLEHLRQMRNPYVHPPRPWDRKKMPLSIRWGAWVDDDTLLVEHEAQKALEILFKLILREPFFFDE